MTSKRAERITGYEVRKMDGVGHGYGLFNGGALDGVPAPVLLCHGRSPADTLSMLVEKNYARIRNVVFTEQNYRCWSCWRLAGLSADHIKARSQGRSDERRNLRGLCSACHENHTNNRTISIHPKMEALMYKVGYRWIGEWESDMLPWGWEKIS